MEKRETEKKGTVILDRKDIAEEMESNLCDFAFFLTVMKSSTAYRSALSIILEEPDIRLKEVKVEQVILNKSGKRAIRLDAWALSEDERQFDMEMQNDTDQDSIPKRSRFYQGLMDSPVLKSGKKTRYRQLPSSTIIFITKDDIFRKDLAKYTFTEQCEEVKGLKLEDGTTKIFLNMTSKNGSKELISLLQYMKKTDIDNPEIKIKDERLLMLDKIVREVRESEEWEAVKMDILDVGINKGIELGIKQGIEKGIEQGIEKGIEKGIEQGTEQGIRQSMQATIESLQEFNISKEDVRQKIAEKFHLPDEKIQEYMEKYWK